ncbi:MAG TPA: homoserine dehydrogenase [Kiritimatiellia bacterium]|nr:homoserine dehydrogenase [Kiritimatiellia bacterium]HRZ12985.1 homoserine dehydrogenase [Kiritimatiellia bacterium]HSA18405.1 homoserine dehydrogenase [Kiritimatiellia bacterium]
MKEIGIGLLGFGTVGAGVVEGLQQNGKLLEERLDLRLALRRLADLDLDSDRGVKADRALMTRDAGEAIRDPNVDIVVELIGGVTKAKEFIRQALELGKPVVTANKALLAEAGAELHRLAAEKKTALYFEASVGGGIPIIKAVREGLVANRITSVYGILNGTCNYILTRMEEEKLPFEQVLKAAQQAGYAEAEPSLDVDGHDTAHKAVVLASLAHGFPVPMSAVHVEGIRNISAGDISYAAEMGYRIKLLAVIKQGGNGVEARVHPTLVPHAHPLAAVSGVFNAVLVSGDIVGDTLYYGRGAGRRATASAVLADLADAARDLSSGARRPPVLRRESGKLRPIGEIVTRCYLRLSLLDKPGVLALVAQALGRKGISIASVMQKETRVGQHVPVLVVTHSAPESAFRAALAEIDRLEVVGAPTVRIRIEDFQE